MKSIDSTLCIPTLNAGRELEELFDSLSNQTYTPNKIIVADSGSTDDTIEIAQFFGADILHVPQGEFDHGGTREFLRVNVKTKIVIFMTQDVILNSIFSLFELINGFEDERVGVVFGRQLPRSDASLISRHLRKYNYGEESYRKVCADIERDGVRTFFCSDSFAAYRADWLDEIGGFHKKIIFGEDALAAYYILKSGGALCYQSKATVIHSHNYTLVQEFKRSFDIGVFHEMHNDVFSPFGSVSQEGLMYVKSLLIDIKNDRAVKAFMYLPFYVLSRYIGYKLGGRFRYVGRTLTKRLSMAPWWWTDVSDK